MYGQMSIKYMRDSYRILVGVSKTNIPLGRRKRGLEGDNKMKGKETGSVGAPHLCG
jgi:hypothetical protein